MPHCAAGTYAAGSVSPYTSDGLTPDFQWVMVLYLCPSGRFVLFGLVPRFEITLSAGEWRQDGSTIQLSGAAVIRSGAECGTNGSSRPVRLVLSARPEGEGTRLTVEQAADGWSPLGSLNTLACESAEDFWEHGLDDEHIPEFRSWQDVDAWATRFPFDVPISGQGS